MLDVVKRIQAAGIEVVVYEPSLNENSIHGCKVVDSLDDFKKVSDVILANRFDSNLEVIRNKTYTRDLWGRD